MDRREKSSRRVRLNTMQIVALGFFGVIFLGGVDCSTGLFWSDFFGRRNPVAANL